MKRAKRFFINGILLGCTTVFLRGAGLSFNVYITKEIGAEGVGLFGLIMSVYMLVTTIASSGASLATTRMVTEEMAFSCQRGMQKVMRVCMGYTLFFGMLSSFLLFHFAPEIGRFWLGDERTIRPLYCLSISLPFIAMSSAMNGYFMAVRRVIKSASAQIFELLIKFLVTFFLLRFFKGQGIEFACVAIVGGGSIAEICSFLYLFVLYRLEQRKRRNNKEKEKRYFKRLLCFAVPVAISSYLRSGLVTLEHILIPKGLKQYGASSSASLSQYGVVHGMVMPLLMFPSAVLGAFSGLLVPELTEYQKIGNSSGISRIVSRALRTTFLFSVGAAGIFLVFAHELGMAVYHSGDAGLFIRFLAPLVVVMYTDGVVDAMLKGLNRQVNSMSYNILDSAISVSLIYSLLPRFGINGYLVVIFITELLNAFLSINCLIKTVNFKLSFRKNIALPCIGILGIGYGVRQLSPFFESFLSSGVSLILSLLLTVIFYLLFIVVIALPKEPKPVTKKYASLFLK